MLDIINLSKTFNRGTINEVKSLNGINCHVEESSFVVLLGTNGSGKSTLLNAVAGTFLPDEGQIKLAGINITRLSEHQRARYIGRVFQNPFLGTAPEMTIAENLALASKRGLTRSFNWAVKKHVREELKKKIMALNMGLEDRLDHPIGMLSGGQRQALTLLMATWLKPELLLLDEHTAALDPKTAAKVIQLTGDLIRHSHLTTLMVTHSMQQAVNMGDRILMLHQGRIVYDFGGQDKQRLKAGDLVALFDEIRRKEQIDIHVAELISQQYI